MTPPAYKAFTLIELIVYIAITAMIITFFASFTFNLSGRIFTVQNRNDGQTEMLFIVERIAREIENSNGIDVGASVFDVDFSRLALITDTGTDTIELTPDGIIQIQRSTGIDDMLSSPSTNITSLVFTNESLPKRPGIIHVSIKSSAFRTAFETAVSYRESIEIN